VTDLPDVYLKFTDGDPEIRGESQDAAYPHSEGWLSIKSFTFGFGWDPQNTPGANLDSLRTQLVKEKDEQKRVLIQQKINALEKERSQQPAADHNQKGSTSGSKGDKGKTLRQRNFTFSRNPGPASKDLLLNLIKRKGKRELGAELIVCRAAGVDIPHGAPKDAKTPFLKFVFSQVELVDCKMQVSRDQPPSESVEFWFGKVQMETIWTDNETGEKIPGGKNRISFDFQSQDKDKKALFEEFLQ